MNLKFIVGGKSQGKTEYVETLNIDKNNVLDNLTFLISDKVDEYIELYGETADFNESVNSISKDIIKDVDVLMSASDEYIIIGCEIGCGIVPMSFKDRLYREVNGRVNCYYAKKADTVIRIQCSIPVIIKGN